MNKEDQGIAFLTEESIKLREEVIFFLKQIEANERFALFSSGAVWALVASMKWNDAMNIIIWMPSIITIVFFIKRKMLTKTLGNIGEYIKNTEKIISEKSSIELGWETYWAKHKEDNLKFNSSYMKWWGNIFWVFVLVTNISLAIFFPFNEFLPK